MAENKQEGKVTSAPEGVGIDARQVKPTPQLSGKELKERLANEQDKELHPDGLPKKEADKTSLPTAADAEPHDPPVRTNRPDGRILQSLATGAGAHLPPDPKEHDEMGRSRYRDQ